MNRRAILIRLALGGAAPSVAWAQARGTPFRIAMLSSNAPEVVGDNVRRLEARLAELGFVEGRDVVYDRRYAHGHMDRIPALAAEVMSLKPDLVIAPNNPEIGALKRLTSTVPIVMVLAQDAPGSGLVRSLAHPGGNVTGMQSSIGYQFGRRLQLLKETIPGLRHVAVLRQKRANSLLQEEGNDAAARAIGLTVSLVEVGDVSDFDAAFAAIRASGAQALSVEPGQLNYQSADRIGAFALDARLPAVGNARRFADQGLLISFGVDLPDLYRRAADYVAKILKGAKPADLPVEQASGYELVFNLRTAAALSIAIPKHLLIVANDVIR
jgi:putative ABC transport system substrate-binding protein